MRGGDERGEVVRERRGGEVMKDRREMREGGERQEGILSRGKL